MILHCVIDIGAVNETFIFSAETTQQCINITVPVDDILESIQISQNIFLITISDGNGTDRSMTAGSLFILDTTGELRDCVTTISYHAQYHLLHLH